MLTPAEAKAQLTGILPFVPTPFRASDQALDIDGLRSNLQFLLQHKVKILGMCGFVGEFAALTLDEYAQVIRVAVEEANGNALVVAGVGHGTKMAIEFAREAQALGADCVMILPPQATDVPGEGLYHHLETIVRSVSIAAMLHSLPGPATLDAHMVARLAEFDNVVAYKDELREIRTFHDIRALVGDRLAYVSANGERMARYYFLDGAGAMATAMGNFDPDLAHEVYFCAATNQRERLQTLLSTKINPWYRLRDKDRAYLSAITKESMNMVGLAGGVPRLPLWPISRADRDELEQILTDLGYLPSNPALVAPVETVGVP